MKYTLILPLLFACKFQTKEPNVAEVMTKGQVPAAECDIAVTPKRKIQIAVCTLPDNKDNEFIAAFSKDHPYQALPFRTSTQIKTAAEKAKAATATQEPVAPAAPPKK